MQGASLISTSHRAETTNRMPNRTDTAPCHFAIVGASFAGNKGAEAMLQSTIAEIRKRRPKAIIHVLSYFPAEDKRLQLPENVYIHSATPAALVLKWLPLGIAARCFPRLKNPKFNNGRAGILNLLCVEALFDIFGVSFMDSRLKFIPFNLLSLTPFIWNHVPVFKISQALGPFRKRVNRMSAYWLLEQLDFTAARGRKTRGMLESIGLGEKTGKVILAADVAFLLPNEESTQATKHPTSKSVAIVPSRVIADKLPGYTEKLTGIAKSLHAAGWGVQVIVHSWREKDGQTRNNDTPIARQIVQRLEDEQVPAELIGYGLDSHLIRSAIGRNTVVLTSRFHGMIAALSESRPVVVVGWSHKYSEVLNDFGLEDHCIRYESFNLEHTIEKIEYCREHADRLTKQISERLPAVRESAERQFTEAFTRLELGHG